MTNWTKLLNFALALLMGLTGTHAMAANISAQGDKPAIVLVAFGTSVPKARKVFDHIDEVARERYPDHEVSWAFTSQFIINKLKKQGLVTKNVEETVAELKAKGTKSVVFQSLHVAPGEEYSNVKKVDMSGLKVAFGDALMTTDADIDAVIGALEKDIDPKVPAVVVAHGNDKYPRFNERLVAFAERIEAAHPQVVVASVEGQPGTEPLQKARALTQTAGTVRFIPLMVVAGDHIMNDVLGDEEDSWKHIVGASAPECAASLGWNDAILDIYFSHLDAALANVSSEKVNR